MSIMNLVQVYNELSGKNLKVWKGKRADLEAKITALQSTGADVQTDPQMDPQMDPQTETAADGNPVAGDDPAGDAPLPTVARKARKSPAKKIKPAKKAVKKSAAPAKPAAAPAKPKSGKKISTFDGDKGPGLKKKVGVGGYCEELLAVVDHHVNIDGEKVDAKTKGAIPVGLAYADILTRVTKKFPQSAVDANHLRWYNGRMRRNDVFAPVNRIQSSWK